MWPPKKQAGQIEDLSSATKKESGKKPDSKAVGMLILLVVVTMTVFAVYRFLLDFYYFEAVLIVYMVLATAFLLTYVIYNRGMSRKGVTPDMLPDEWSEEEKAAFIEDGKRKLERSRWLLIPIFAFFFTFAVDLIELIVVPFFQSFLFS